MVHEQQPSANDTCWNHKSACGMECCIILHKILLRIKICSGQCPQLSTLPYHGTSIGEVHSGHAELLESAWCLVQWGYTLDTLSYWVVRLEFLLLQVWQITFALQQHASIISFLFSSSSYKNHYYYFPTILHGRPNLLWNPPASVFIIVEDTRAGLLHIRRGDWRYPRYWIYK